MTQTAADSIATQSAAVHQPQCGLPYLAFSFFLLPAIFLFCYFFLRFLFPAPRHPRANRIMATLVVSFFAIIVIWEHLAVFIEYDRYILLSIPAMLVLNLIFSIWYKPCTKEK